MVTVSATTTTVTVTAAAMTPAMIPAMTVPFRTHRLVRLAGPGGVDGDVGLLGDGDVLWVGVDDGVCDVLGQRCLLRHKLGYLEESNIVIN